MYPLFHAVALPASIDVVKKLHNLNPMAIQEVNLEDLTVLHHACIFGADYKIIKYLVKHYPQACAMQKKHVYTPLHSALEANMCSVTLAKLLVKTNPDVLHMKTKLKETPKDIALRKMHAHTAPAMFTIRETEQKKTTGNTTRLQEIQRGNYSRSSLRSQASYEVYKGAPKVEVTQELLDILTPAAEKNVDNEADQVKGLMRRMGSSFTSFSSTRRLSKSSNSMSFCSSMSSQNDLSSHVEKD